MHWNQIEKNWAEMTRRLQAASFLPKNTENLDPEDRGTALPPDNSEVLARTITSAIAVEPTH